VFWHNVDPLVKDKQFCDSGDQYRTAIFYTDEAQKKLAEETKKQVEAKFAPRTVYTQIVQAGPFYDAEDYTRIIIRRTRRATILPLELRPRSAPRAALGARRSNRDDHPTHDLSWRRGRRCGLRGDAFRRRDGCRARAELRDPEERRRVAPHSKPRAI